MIPSQVAWIYTEHCSRYFYTRRHEQIQISYHHRRLQAKSEHASKGAIVAWLQSCFLSSVSLTRSRKPNPLIDTLWPQSSIHVDHRTSIWSSTRSQAFPNKGRLLAGESRALHLLVQCCPVEFVPRSYRRVCTQAKRPLHRV